MSQAATFEQRKGVGRSEPTGPSKSRTDKDKGGEEDVAVPEGFGLLAEPGMSVHSRFLLFITCHSTVSR